MIQIREKELQLLWTQGPKGNTKLLTQDGRNLEILSPGRLNTDSGPDFFNARIVLNGQLWVGNIEIHIRSSDWLRHGHQNDPSYGNVILHVVLMHDQEIVLPDGSLLPVLVIREESILRFFEQSAPTGIDEPIDAGILQRYAEMRLKRKSMEFGNAMQLRRGDLNRILFGIFCRSYGTNTNAEPFEQLAQSFEYTWLQRLRISRSDVEALLFGQSGLLPALPTDSYSAELLQRYQILARKWPLRSMNAAVWKFMRMRPVNFPVIRISQLAGVICTQENLIETLRGCVSPADVQPVLSVPASDYWNDHFRFGIPSSLSVKYPGEAFILSVVINGIVPLKYFHGEMSNNADWKTEALQLLRSLPPEKSNIVSKSEYTFSNALETQGFLEYLRAGGY